MATIDFPSNPSVNDYYTFNNKTWVFNGQGWQLASTGAINGIIIGNTTPAAGNFTTLGATGNIITSANITASYLFGNGSQLTGLNSGNLSVITRASGAVNFAILFGFLAVYGRSGTINIPIST